MRLSVIDYGKRSVRQDWRHIRFYAALVIFMVSGGLPVLAQDASAQSRAKVIVGKVLDTDMAPVIGASIMVKGTQTGTITDIDGSFELEVTSGDVLTVASLGYLTEEIKVGDRSSIEVILEEDSQLLEEVVVVGYGTVKRVNASGAIGTTGSRTFESRPVQNAISALQGEMPGVIVTRNGGTPGGSDVNISVRDISSINGGSPLVLVEGAEGTLSLLNPSDIESISVLKDASAAIYGARAADGVILVTT